MIKDIAIIPNQLALDQIAQNIWDISTVHQMRPLTLLSTSGPIYTLRQILESKRPKPCPIPLAFLPTMYGLNQWLSQAPGLKNIPTAFTDFQRWEVVYQQLGLHPEMSKKLGVHSEGSKWNLAQTIVQGCDYLSSAYLSMSDSVKDFGALELKMLEASFHEALKKAYPIPSAQTLVVPEADILLTFWQYITTIQDPPVQRQLSWQFRAQELLTTQNLPPLIWIEFTQVKGAERLAQEHFLQTYAKLATVYRMSLDWTTVGLWPECLNEDQMDSKALSREDQVEQNRLKSLQEHWSLFALPSFEKVALATVHRVASHVAAARTNIAIIAQDRLVVRRVRALLERYEGISIQDATGWKLSTTGVAAAVNSWIEVCREPLGPSLHQMIGFLKNPLIDWSVLWQKIDPDHAPFEIAELLSYLDQEMLHQMTGPGWSTLFQVFNLTRDDSGQTDTVTRRIEKSFQSSSTRHLLSAQSALNISQQKCLEELAQKLLHYLQHRSQRWVEKDQTSANFAQQLIEQLEDLAMFSSLEKDLAGQTVIEQLKSLTLMQQVKIPAQSWFSLFDLCLEEASFIEESPQQAIRVSIFPLASVRLKRFDAVIVVGADDEHLPPRGKDALIFSQSLINELGLASTQDDYQQQARDLSQLMQSHQYVDFIWQEYQKAGEKNRRSAWLTRLCRSVSSFHEQVLPLNHSRSSNQFIPPTTAFLGSQHPLLPTHLSPSSYRLLRECPYRFYVAKSLKLASPKALEDESIFSTIGSLLHHILDVFYRQSVSQEPSNLGFVSHSLPRKEWLTAQLIEISEQYWAELIGRDGQFLGNQHQWMTFIPSLIDWQMAHEQAGWHFFKSEEWVEYVLAIPDHGPITIQGRVDRIDLNNTSTMILDYKVSSLKKIKEKGKNLVDDPQLLIYALALDQASAIDHRCVSQIQWVSLKPDSKDLTHIHTEEISPQRLDTLKGQIQKDLKSVWDGKSLRASGPNHVCRYCEERGICRKGMWQDD